MKLYHPVDGKMVWTPYCDPPPVKETYEPGEVHGWECPNTKLLKVPVKSGSESE